MSSDSTTTIRVANTSFYFPGKTDLPKSSNIQLGNCTSLKVNDVSIVWLASSPSTIKFAPDFLGIFPVLKACVPVSEEGPDQRQLEAIRLSKELVILASSTFSQVQLFRNHADELLNELRMGEQTPKNVEMMSQLEQMKGLLPSLPKTLDEANVQNYKLEVQTVLPELKDRLASLNLQKTERRADVINTDIVGKLILNCPGKIILYGTTEQHTMQLAVKQAFSCLEALMDRLETAKHKLQPEQQKQARVIANRKEASNLLKEAPQAPYNKKDVTEFCQKAEALVGQLDLQLTTLEAASKKTVLEKLAAEKAAFAALAKPEAATVAEANAAKAVVVETASPPTVASTVGEGAKEVVIDAASAGG